VAYGYRFSEFNSPIKQEKIKDNVSFSVSQWSDRDRRPPMCVSLGCHLTNFKMPFGDLSDTVSSMAGVLKRTCYKHPVPDDALRSELTSFVGCWLKKNLSPLNVDHDVSFETWLSGTKYTGSRKNELREVWSNFTGVLTPKDRKCKSFNKAESYSAYKHLRGINSRSDTFKCFVGPTFAAIEKVLFQMKWFIKKVPVRDRARHVWEAMSSPNAQFYATDYSAFESHFDNRLMTEVEFKLYEYMTAALPTGASWFAEVAETLGGFQTCMYKGFEVDGVSSRMSGEMCTSLGNSFANLMIFLFVASKAGIKEEDISGFVEGDDGLFKFENHQDIDDSLFAKLGLTIKIEKHTELNQASFCGLIFDPDSLIIITDPREVLADFAWAGPKYVKCRDVRLLELLKAKSLSFLHQYPGCPIIQELALYGLRMTRQTRLTKILEDPKINQWERDQLLAAVEYISTHDAEELVRPVSRRSREMVYEMYGIPTHEQLRIENLLRKKQSLTPIDLGDVDYMPSDWQHFNYNYVRETQGDYPVAFSAELVHNNLPATLTIKSNDFVVGSDFNERLYVSA